jgi:hypothetical protein
VLYDTIPKETEKKENDLNYDANSSVADSPNKV